MTSEFMTDSQILEQRITDALTTIRREWGHMLPRGSSWRPTPHLSRDIERTP